MSPQPVFRVQLSQIDYTLASPGSLDNSSLPQVPVIRVYGPSSTGKKACVHVHQVYPYFFVEYKGTLNAKYVHHYISRLTQSLNHAISLSLKRNPHSSKAQYVRAMLLVKGIHFYGFHSSYSPFLKIYIANPAHVNRAATILQSGSVMSTRFRIFESHLSYILQFMCDYGLYGCGWLEAGSASQRFSENAEMLDVDIFETSPYFRQSRMPLEVDIIAPQILNRFHLSARNIHQKLEIPTDPLPLEPLVLSVRELWEDERERRRARGLHPSPEIPLDPSDSSREPRGAWVAEARWWEELRRKIEREKEVEVSPQEVVDHGWERWTMTTFESIEALWETCWKSWRPIGLSESVDDNNTEMDISGGLSQTHWAERRDPTGGGLEETGIDVNISMISSQEISQIIEQEEADWFRLMGHGNQHITEDEIEDEETEYETDEVHNTDFQDDQRTGDLSVRGDSSSRHDPFLSVDPNSDIPSIVGLKTQSFSYSRALMVDLPAHPAPHFESSFKTAIEETTLSPTIGDNVAPLLRLIPSVAAVDSPRKVLMQTLSPEHLDALRATKKDRFRISQPDSYLPSTLLSSPVLFKSPRVEPVLPARPNIDFCTIKATNSNEHVYAHTPPTALDLFRSLDGNNIARKIYRAPFYSRNDDLPENSREYAGLVYHIQGEDRIIKLDEWKDDLDFEQVEISTEFEDIGGWEYAGYPPSAKQIKKWLGSKEGIIRLRDKSLGSRSQIEGPTQANIYALKNLFGTKPGGLRERQGMSSLSLEVFAPTKEEKIADATIDRIAAIFYSYQSLEGEIPRSGVLVVQDGPFHQHRLGNSQVEVVASELDLLNTVVDVVLELDPDLIIGWEVERGSWGYLDARAHHYGFGIPDLISRAPALHSSSVDMWGMRHTTTFKVPGRHVLNLWRIMRSELTLTSHSFEHVAFHVLQKRVPHYTSLTLSEWYYDNDPGHLTQVLQYFLNRIIMTLEILDRSEVVTKTAEFARVFGVDFFSVINRGSQFKVESFMFRIAKPESFVLFSPSRLEVGKQNAAECMPLIMEPLSAFYSSPLVVLDFQSLYPSIMIAYNYCYSTCLGRVKEFQGRNKLGVVNLDQPPGLLERLSDHIHIAPNGIMYVRPEVRKGLLGRMLVELLETRVMIKQALKGVTNDIALRRILDARQLSLKYISNVTYGYTSATYSGRMPAVEIADSIVQSGRETLEKAITLINETKKWGAQVVYGDTDSLFIYLRGKTKEQAFRIGNDIADTITAQNPSPVKLKFEKVYLPCVLIAKKRYVGFKYERVDDREPVFDAKGIETVRRDGVLAQRKMTENCLKILFRTQNLSDVKEYCCRSWMQILENRTSVQDFIFAKEIKMGTYSEKGQPPPGVTVAARRMVADPKNEPQYGERIPYVITRGPPDARLVDRAVDPLEFLQDSQLHLDTDYYISKVLIPPLERIFNLLGVDVRKWFIDMPKLRSLDVAASPTKAKDDDETQDPLNIDEHFHSSQCLICGELASQGLCDDCFISPQETLANLASRIQADEKRLTNAQRICVTCTESKPGDEIRCESLDCPWFFSRKRTEGKGDFLIAIEEIMDGLNERVETDTLIEVENPIPDTVQREPLDDEAEYYRIDPLQLGLGT
ncbi:hypothetical protein BDZ94DRAFT_1276753 [Collybia nuda]|uniref:DNA polymerase n=1 Tax=Collybia nuda TaxID=64659 RepID=A0A9P5XT12_9AGAR|nr:hypothetical protein BDZ94DRAFT_1276753 [Collybia nuda]